MAGKTKTKRAPKVKIKERSPAKNKGITSLKLRLKVPITGNLPLESTSKIEAICKADPTSISIRAKITAVIPKI